MKDMKFPFSDAPNTACFTCRHVLEENRPIRYVSHDEDGYWQFLCGGGTIRRRTREWFRWYPFGKWTRALASWRDWTTGNPRKRLTQRMAG